MSVIERYIEGEGSFSLPFTMPKNPKTVLVAFIISFVLNLILIFTYNGFKRTEVIFQEQECTAGDTVTAYISGAVKNPGVYKVDNSGVIGDLIHLAGGFTKEAEKGILLRSLNLSSAINTNSHLYIPFNWETIAVRPTTTELIPLEFASSSFSPPDLSSPASSTNNILNINDASKDMLLEVKGVGESYAGKIEDGRPYTSKEDFISKVSLPKNVLDNLLNSYELVFQ